MDIRFEKDGYRFNARSSCIIKDKEHKRVILNVLRAIKDHEAFLLPGGKIDALEASYEAVKREIQEELGITCEYKLIQIEENIIKNSNLQSIEFVYYAEVDNFDNIKTLDDGWDQFKIIDIEDIDNVDIRPKSLNRLIKQKEYKEISHNINYDFID